ncbi:MAG: PAS domain S-box protein [Bacteroidia bacterium]|nr:PAS domain S-box protein [Bacteroidia bacterium]
MIKNNQDVFQILSEAISEGVVIVDETQTIIATNSSTDDLFGFEKEELNGKSLNVLLPSKYHSAHDDHFKSFYKKGEKRSMGHGRNLYGVHRSGNPFPVEVGLNPFILEGKKYVMALIIDISERLEAEKVIKDLNANLEDKISNRTKQLNLSVAQLKQLNTDLEKEIKKRIRAEDKIKSALQKEKELNELKTKFLSLVSHEFKTPLSGILTSSVLVGKYRETSQQAKRDKHLNTIVDKVNYLNSILNDFLSIERIDSGKVKYNFTNFMLSKVVNEAIYNANMLLKPGQRINYPSDIDDYNIYQDQKVLELILSNLINNAIKYSPPDTRISLEFNMTPKKIIFKVIDEGIGIPEKDQKNIFDRYFRAENALLDQGTGIGLNIVKGHVESLGGNINFTSKENKGTTFTVELPIIKK